MEHNQNNRIAFIDYAKSICIFLMVIGHSSDNQLLRTYIYSFHMPALFIISGYLFKPHSFIKTIIAFSVPVLFFSMINLICLLLLGDIKYSTLTIKSVFQGFIHYRYGLDYSFFTGEWFLWSLIGLRFIFGDIKQITFFRKHYILIAMICSIYMTFESNLIRIDTIFYGYLIGRMVPSLLFFCVGLYLKDRKWYPYSISSEAILFLVICFVLLPPINGSVGIYENDYGISYIIFSTIACLNTFLLFWGTSKLPSSKHIEVLSTGTLVILGTHMPILHILHHLFPRSINFLFPIFTIIICYFIIKICKKHCPILLGK